jgi:hypothetical protein
MMKGSVLKIHMIMPRERALCFSGKLETAEKELRCGDI